MERKKASEFPQELLDLSDLYVHGDMTLTGARFSTARSDSQRAA